MNTELLAGTTVAGRYRLLEPLGQGGMGEVWLVEDRLAGGALLALKRFSLRPGAGADAIGQMEREFRTVRSIRHPYVAGVVDFGWIDTVAGEPEAFFTAEYVGGPDLYRATRGANLELIWRLMAQLLEALACIHAHGIVHRDVKPSNVLVTRVDGEPQVKLIDFGLAAAAELAVDEVARGTPRYMAPEAIIGRAVDQRTDLYAFGITLFEVLTGKPPFRGRAREVLRQHLEARMPPPSTMRPELGGRVDRLILRLCAKDPRDRFRSAKQVLEALRSIAGEAVGGLEAKGVGAHGAPWCGCERERQCALRWLERALPGLGKRRPARDGRSERQRSDGVDRADRTRSRQVALEAAAPPALVVYGDVGVGKTTLLTELKHHAQIMGAIVLEAVCESSARAYAPFAELLRSLRRVRASSERDDEALLLEPSLQRLLGEGESALEGGARWGEAAASRDIRRERERLFEAVVRFVTEAGRERGVLLIVHDLHRADHGTHALFGHLATRLTEMRTGAVGAARSPAVAIACSARGRSRDDLPWLLSTTVHADLEWVALAPLDRTETGTLVRRLWGEEEPLDPALIDRIYEHTGGNPFFIRETVRHLIERRGDGGGVAGGQRLANALPEMPQSVAEVLRDRLAHLGPREEIVLRVLAASRLPLGAKDLAALIGLRGRPLRSALARLVDRGMVLAQERMSRRAPRYRCVHELLREVVLRSLSGADRRALHERLGRWFEEQAQRRAEAVDAAVLAEHFREARLAAPAFRYAVLAGDDAFVLFANERARMHYREALRLAPEARASDAERLAVLEQLGVVELRLGAYDEAEKAFRRAIDLWLELAGGVRGEPSQRSSTVLARLYRRLGETLEAASSYDAALEALSQGVRALDMELSSLEGARLLARTASVYIRTGRYDEALVWVDTGLSMAGDAPSAERAALLNAAGVASLCRGEARLAAERFQASLEIRRQLGDMHAIAQSLNNLGAAYVEAGQYGRAVPYFEEALELSTRVGDVRGAAQTAAHLGDVRLRLGEHDRALVLFERGLALAERLGDPDGELVALQRLATFEIELTHLDDAALRLERMERIVERLREEAGGDERWPTRECVRAAVVAGRFLHVVGALERALVLFDQALEYARRHGALREQAEALKLRGRVLTDLDRFDEAERSINEAQTVFAQLDNPHEQTRTTIDRVEVMVERGELELAEMALNGLEAQVRTLHLPHLVAPWKLVEGRYRAARARPGDRRAIGAALLSLDQARKSAAESRRPELSWRIEFAAAEACARAGVKERALRAAIRGMETLREVADRVPARWRACYLQHPRRLALRDLFRRLREAAD